MTNECLTYTIPEAGKVLGIGRRLAYEMAKEGKIPTLKFGSRIVVPKKALEDMVNGRQTIPTA